MAESPKDIMLTGMRNAHGLESQAVTTLERQVKAAEGYPALQAKLREHLEVSGRQAQRLEDMLKARGTDVSALKKAGMQLAATFQGLVHSTADDEVLKNTYTAYAYEHFEIASYRSLAVMARRCGDAEVERLAQEIGREEEEMAGWLGDHLDEVTEQYLSVAERG